MLGLGRFSSFLIQYTVSGTPWMGDQPALRLLSTYKTTYKQNKHTDINVSSGVRSHDTRFWTDEGSSFAHCDQLINILVETWNHIKMAAVQSGKCAALLTGNIMCASCLGYRSPSIQIGEQLSSVLRIRVKCYSETSVNLDQMEGITARKMLLLLATAVGASSPTGLYPVLRDRAVGFWGIREGVRVLAESLRHTEAE